jgi:hypothetical protein
VRSYKNIVKLLHRFGIHFTKEDVDVFAYIGSAIPVPMQGKTYNNRGIIIMNNCAEMPSHLEHRQISEKKVRVP